MPARACSRSCTDQVIEDRIVGFIFVVDCFLLVGLPAMLGWLDTMMRWLGALTGHAILLLIVQKIADLMIS